MQNTGTSYLCPEFKSNQKTKFKDRLISQIIPIKTPFIFINSAL